MISTFSIDFKPLVCAAGVVTAAVTSGYLFYRWQKRRNERQKKSPVDAVVQTEDIQEISDPSCAPVSDTTPDSGPGPSLAPELVPALASATDPVLAPDSASGPGPTLTPALASALATALAYFGVNVPDQEDNLNGITRSNQNGRLIPYWTSRSQGLTKSHFLNERLFTDWSYDGNKTVVVDYYSSSIYNGPKSVHTWMLIQNLYKPFPELSTRFLGSIKMIVIITRLGRQIVKLCHQTKINMVDTFLVPGNILRITKTLTIKEVNVEDGVCWSTESNSTEVKDIPVFTPPTIGTYADMFV